MNTDNIQLINDETIKQLVGKKVIFKLTDDEDDEGPVSYTHLRAHET